MISEKFYVSDMSGKKAARKKVEQVKALAIQA